MKIHFMSVDLNNNKVIDDKVFKFEIYLLVHYDYINNNIISVKYKNGNIVYTEYSYINKNYCEDCYTFDNSLGRIQIGSSYDPYESMLYLSYKKDFKTNIVVFNTKKKEIENILVLPNNWFNHLFFYPGPISTITQATFNELGNKISIKFDMDNKIFDNHNDCKNIFTRMSVRNIGYKAYCKWEANQYVDDDITKFSNTLSIYTSSDATIVPGQVLYLKKNSILSRYSYNKYSQGNVIITGTNFTKPEVVIYGSKKLSYCDKLYLDGS